MRKDKECNAQELSSFISRSEQKAPRFKTALANMASSYEYLLSVLHTPLYIDLFFHLINRNQQGPGIGLIFSPLDWFLLQKLLHLWSFNFIKWWRHTVPTTCNIRYSHVTLGSRHSVKLLHTHPQTKFTSIISIYVYLNMENMVCLSYLISHHRRSEFATWPNRMN
jgi:hypothetical protein